MKLKLARPQSPFIKMAKKPFQGRSYKKPDLKSKSGNRYSGQKTQQPAEKPQPKKKENDDFSSEEFEPYDMEDDDFEDLPDVDVKSLIKKPFKPNFAKKKPGQKYNYQYVKPSDEVSSPTPIQTEKIAPAKKTFKSLKQKQNPVA
jgi:hypothetical protein